MKYNIETHLLPIKGACNVRDLGNYPTRDGRTTRPDVFFRSDSTAAFTGDDIRLLKDKNLGLVVDLRSEDEITREPSVFMSANGFTYRNVQVIDNVHSQFTPKNFPKSMGEMYIRFLDEVKPAFQNIFTLFADGVDKGSSCLFHCTAGKDRTGTVAMLLLDLAQVDDDIIIEDYAATDEFTRHVWEAQLAMLQKQGIPVPEFALRAEAHNMVEALGHLRKTYGNARNYLKDCKLTDMQLDVITEHFVS